MKSSQVLQKQIAQEGRIVGTVAAVRAVILSILEDPRFHVIEAVYGVSKRPSPNRVPGTPYRVTAAKRGPTKGVQSEQEVAERVVNNGLINVYCADTHRHGYRSLKVHLIQAIWVYNGHKDAKGKAIFVRIPVMVV
jgi:hypothetical protein